MVSEVFAVEVLIVDLGLQDRMVGFWPFIRKVRPFAYFALLLHLLISHECLFKLDHLMGDLTYNGAHIFIATGSLPTLGGLSFIPLLPNVTVLCLSLFQAQRWPAFPDHFVA